MADPYVPEGDDAEDLRNLLAQEQIGPGYLEGVQRATAKAFKQRWDALYAEPPETLYHYTGGRGFEGIVRSGVLHATNALYLNDRSELLHIADVVRAVTETHLPLVPGSHGASLFGRTIRDRLKAADLEVFVVCFCQEDDLLSQWRGYAPGQTGYSVAFQSRHLAASHHPAGLVSLRRAIYGADTQRDLVALVIRSLGEAVRRVIDAMGSTHDFGQVIEVADKAADSALAVLAEAAFCFKSDGFSEEKEWRLVLSRDPLNEGGPWSEFNGAHVDYREGAASLVPFVAIEPRDAGGDASDESPLPISGLTVGPTPFGQLAVDAAKGFLAKHGYSVPVGLSRIPLRG